MGRPARKAGTAPERSTPPGSEPNTGHALTTFASLRWMVRTSRALHPQNTVDGCSQAAMLFFHQLALRTEMRQWRLAGESPLQKTLAWRPALVSVVRRPYINTFWGAPRRVAAVEQHYCQLTGGAKIFQLKQKEAVHLATVSAKGSSIELVIDSPAWFIHEGETCLNLFHAGERIYTLAFSLGFDHGEPVAHVGALQGFGQAGALDLYRTLTHALHGLRPRDLLIGAFRMICEELGLERWLAVSDRHHVSCNPYFRDATRIHFSYDEAWAEHGGSLRPDGFYDMPMQLPRRSRADMPCRKRNLYRQRYDLLDRLEHDLRQALRGSREP